MKRSQRAFAVVHDTFDIPVETSQQILLRGFQFHQSGMIIEAAACYAKVLEKDPNSSDALHLLGLVQLSNGDHASAVDLITKAVTIQPDNPDYWSNLGNAYLAYSSLNEALDCYRKAMILCPSHSDAHYNAANVLRSLGQIEEALAEFDEAIRLNPTMGHAMFNKANTLREAKRYDEAIDTYRLLIEIAPDWIDAYINLGTSYELIEDDDAAIFTFNEALKLAPNKSTALNNLGNLMMKRGQYADAIAFHERAVAYAPSDPTVKMNLGTSLWRFGRRGDAEIAYLGSLGLDSSQVDVWTSLAGLRYENRQFHAAVDAYEQAKRLDPESVFRDLGYGICLLKTNQLDASATFFADYLVRKTDDADAFNNLGLAHQLCGNPGSAIDCIETAIRRSPKNMQIRSNLVMCSAYCTDEDHPSVMSAARQFAASTTDMIEPFVLEPRELPERIKVGFVSADFSSHPVGLVCEKLFRELNNDRIEVILYAQQLAGDEYTERIIEASSKWISIHSMSDRQVADRVRSDGIDILIDLSGHTENNRLGVFAYHPAPVTASWLGFFATTGMKQMDYLIGDSVLVPESEEGDYVEKIARVDGCMYGYNPTMADGIDVSEPPVIENGWITFGSANNLPKISDETIALWARVMAAVPNSKLLLNRPQLTSRFLTRYLSRRLVEAGIDEDRIQIEPTVGKSGYLKGFAQIDIILDTIPFSGGTTTCESLWMGVPVVTLPSKGIYGRMSQDILKTVGHPEWIATDADDYVAIATALASDVDKLRSTRETLRDETKNSPLCNFGDLARRVGDMLVDLAKR